MTSPGASSDHTVAPNQTSGERRVPSPEGQTCRSRPGDETETAPSEQVGGLTTTVEHSHRTCAECGGRFGMPKPGRMICARCHLDHIAGLRRRREAELRLAPLSGWAA